VVTGGGAAPAWVQVLPGTPAARRLLPPAMAMGGALTLPDSRCDQQRLPCLLQLQVQAGLGNAVQQRQLSGLEAGGWQPDTAPLDGILQPTDELAFWSRLAAANGQSDSGRTHHLPCSPLAYLQLACTRAVCAGVNLRALLAGPYAEAAQAVCSSLDAVRQQLQALCQCTLDAGWQGAQELALQVVEALRQAWQVGGACLGPADQRW